MYFQEPNKPPPLLAALINSTQTHLLKIGPGQLRLFWREEGAAGTVLTLATQGGSCRLVLRIRAVPLLTHLLAALRKLKQCAAQTRQFCSMLFCKWKIFQEANSHEIQNWLQHFPILWLGSSSGFKFVLIQLHKRKISSLLAVRHQNKICLSDHVYAQRSDF